MSGGVASGCPFPLVWAAQKKKQRMQARIRSVDAYNAILTVFGKDTFPALWASAQLNLGNAYWGRIQEPGGEPRSRHQGLSGGLDRLYPRGLAAKWSDGPEQSRHRLCGPHPGQPGGKPRSRHHGLRDGLDRPTREAFPQDWAKTQNNLGIAYHNRIQGSRAENIEAAIKAYQAALTVIPARPSRKTGPRPKTISVSPITTASRAAGRRISKPPSRPMRRP